jgi:hypothetical protein
LFCALRVVESDSMRHGDWEAGATADETGRGITRREALKRGTVLGLGLVWVTPEMSSFRMTAQFAEATSPVPEAEVSDTTAEIEDEVEGVEIENDEQVVSGQLPFTGLPLEQALPLAGGALATGAALVRAARERKESPEPVADETADGV